MHAREASPLNLGTSQPMNLEACFRNLAPLLTHRLAPALLERREVIVEGAVVAVAPMELDAESRQEALLPQSAPVFSRREGDMDAAHAQSVGQRHEATREDAAQLGPALGLHRGEEQPGSRDGSKRHACE